MAAREFIILSSSPPGIPDSDCIFTPPSARRKSIPSTSSPELPALGTLLTRRPAAYATGLRSGSHAAEVPADATFGFASAAALIKQQKLTLDHEDAGAPVDASNNPDSRKSAPPRRPKKPTKRAKEPEEANTAEDMSASKPKDRQTAKKATRKTKPEASTGEHAAEDSQPADHAASCSTRQDDAAEVKPKARKPRAKKSDTETQNRSRKTKAPEQQASVVDTEENAVQPVARRVRNATGTESAHFSRANSVSEQPPAVAAVNDDEPLALEQALSRRMDWTPPRDTTSPTLQHKQLQALDEQQGSPKSIASRATREGSFASLISAFGYNDQTVDVNAPKLKRNASGEAFTKRRKIELISSILPQTTVESRETTPPKEDAPKKKPRTITELATAAYRTPEISPIVSDFFAPRGGSATTTEPTKPDKEKAPARRKNQTKKAEGKSKKPTAKPKKAAKPMAQKLLSPETAKLRYNRQDILFGTSSQLVREDSPTFIRDLQQAMRESEATAGDEVHDVETLHLRPAAAGSGFSLMGRRKGLWAAAARDFDDGFLEIEEIEKSVGLNGADEPTVMQEGSVEASKADADLPSPTQFQAATTFIDVVPASDVVGGNSVTDQENDTVLMDIDDPPDHDELAVVRCTNADTTSTLTTSSPTQTR
ncbi:uncharacterized protein K452DRAFT_285194 [Aplosporella prunicola CBS 121167]|uniref:Structure-specific endonuclease subunit SLX4 n=1 Tax=Aplosporella prunicola CBS 121167 TaxID=1176127 RepID=A0A6A6BIM2_9PEZI|nr:uncharacterized protein K452DRAFT_285194 [Aplosporella prunicola CBS 121167]KAF2143990.1 hypothetical protein K452DRAFT_285194 [Aplosporella prunicola CBS 121167]